jgi:hypothetical protein
MMAYLWKVADAAYPTGSRVICSPPVLDTDEDYVVLIRPGTLGKLGEAGFRQTSREDDYGIEGFTAWRRGPVNLICTNHRRFYEKFVNATRLARKLNLTGKEQRIALFQAVLYGNFPAD